MKENFWKKIEKKAKKEKRPFFSLAPMEAVTDSIFRRVVAQAYPPDVFFTEFTNSLSIIHPQAKFSAKNRLYISKSEKVPVVAQLWGDNERIFYKAGEKAKNLGYKAIDINMGCPTSKIIKNGGGADLIRHPKKAAKIISSLKKTGLPISVKTRLGFSNLSEMNKWIPWILKQRVSLITIHLRTRKEMSKTFAHYEFINRLIKFRNKISPNTLLQINGDIKDYQQGIRIYNQHPGVDGIMIGRGIFQNPYCFEKKPISHNLNNLLSLFKMQLNLYESYIQTIGEKRFETLRRFFKIYIRNLHNAKYFREKLMSTHSPEEAKKIIKEIEKNYN